MNQTLACIWDHGTWNSAASLSLHNYDSLLKTPNNTEGFKKQLEKHMTGILDSNQSEQ